MGESAINLQEVEGILVPDLWNKEILLTALHYKAQPEDMFLCVFPKSGTTWMQVIMYALLNEGRFFDENMSDYFNKSPFFETIGEEGIKKMQRPFVMKTHLPFHKVPYHPQAKYICVIRNPKDVCVSYFFFVAEFFGFPTDQQAFDEFFELFIRGQIIFGNYFDYVISLWSNKNLENVFLTSYEQMKNDLPAIITRLAQFLDIELTVDLLNRIVKVASFDYMKERFDREYAKQAQTVLNDPFTKVALPMDIMHLANADRLKLVREGKHGNWNSVMSTEQAKRLDKLFSEKLAHLPGISELLLCDPPVSV